MALKAPSVIIPGAYATHATLAARYMQECLANVIYPDLPVAEQPPDLVRKWIPVFLDSQVALEVA